ncbi:MAG: AzlD domain-containing protein [Lachnospiraceae bacterium]|nr:AzlD domain-containing protein [Lachnospiraceae bacterium]
MNANIYIYILVMAIVTYLIRLLPLTIIRTEIKNKYIRSFLFYVPYVTLSVMTFPAILYATSGIYSALAGFVVALIVATKGGSLVKVAAAAVLTVFIFELFI